MDLIFSHIKFSYSIVSCLFACSFLIYKFHNLSISYTGLDEYIRFDAINFFYNDSLFEIKTSSLQEPTIHNLTRYYVLWEALKKGNVKFIKHSSCATQCSEILMREIIQTVGKSRTFGLDSPRSSSIISQQCVNLDKILTYT